MISIELEVNKLSSLSNIFRESPEQEASLVDEETDFCICELYRSMSKRQQIQGHKPS